MSKINKNSKYYKRKIKILGFSNEFFTQHVKVNLKLLDGYFIDNNIEKIDLFKIDTEGNEYFVLKGSIKTLLQIKYIYFEHHYD